MVVICHCSRAHPSSFCTSSGAVNQVVWAMQFKCKFSAIWTRTCSRPQGDIDSQSKSLYVAKYYQTLQYCFSCTSNYLHMICQQCKQKRLLDSTKLFMDLFMENVMDWSYVGFAWACLYCVPCFQSQICAISSKADAIRWLLGFARIRPQYLNLLEQHDLLGNETSSYLPHLVIIMKN